MITLFFKGGPVMWVLLLCSILGFYIIFYKLFYLIFQSVSFTKIQHETRHLLSVHPVELVIEKLQSERTLLHQAAAHALSFSNDSSKNSEDCVKSFTLAHVTTLEKYMSILSGLITITPILGLMGTVLGLMNIFNVISGGGMGDSQALSIGIAEALITTVTGLGIATPFIIMHHYINQRIEHLGFQLERMIIDVNQFFDPQ